MYKMDDVCTAVRFAMDHSTGTGVSTLKDKQKEAIHDFVRGHDCFVILPNVHTHKHTHTHRHYLQ